ncbi:unnamed protein product [Durusdinium trenchii]|uniref:EcxA zinc-binding domain-containing protein n=1 Tax=Durusdinium trenchii TaxID=1381693 RepID=A0ABP0P1E5_9DINO
MDYVPTNIPDADDPDKAGREDVHAFGPVIGAYDKLAIAFGYTPVKKETPKREHWPRIAPELQNILKEAEAYEAPTGECLTKVWQSVPAGLNNHADFGYC